MGTMRHDVAELSLSPQDAALLRLAGQTVLALGQPDGAAAERALVALSRQAAPDRPPVHDPCWRYALGQMSGDEGHLATLARAVTEPRRVSFRYRAGETPADQTRRVEPWGIGYRNGGWYLAGFDRDRRDSRVFRVGRIAGEVSSARRSGAFEVPPSVDLARFFEAAPWSFGPVHGPSVEARVVVEAGAADRLLASLGDGVAVRHLDDGRVVVRMMVRDAGSFFDWVLPLGRKAELVSPSDLRAQLAVRLETTAVAWSR